MSDKKVKVLMDCPHDWIMKYTPDIRQYGFSSPLGCREPKDPKRRCVRPVEHRLYKAIGAKCPCTRIDRDIPIWTRVCKLCGKAETIVAIEE